MYMAYRWAVIVDCAPKVADLFLYWYEHDYISKAATMH